MNLSCSQKLNVSAQKEDKFLQREARHISLFGDKLVKVYFNLSSEIIYRLNFL